MDKKYYAVERSGDSLKHYGVKGMRWGVKKAIAAGSDKKMARAYKKASKRLKKLQTRANIDAQKANVGVQAKKAVRSGIATAGLGALTANAGKQFIKGVNTKTYSYSRGSGMTVKDGIYKARLIPGEASSNHFLGVGAATAAGLGKTAYHAGKAIASKYRTTKKGHAKAVAKANAWKSEMNKAFAGTKYDANRKRSKKRRNIT